MPVVNLCGSHTAKVADQRVAELMLIYRNRAGLKTWKDVGRLCGMCENTILKRVREPENITRGEMRRIIRVLKIPDEEIRPYL